MSSYIIHAITCLVIEAAIITFAVIYFLKSKTLVDKKNAFFFIPIYLLLVYIYLIGYCCQDNLTFLSVIESLGDSLKIFVFSMETKVFKDLVELYPIYYPVIAIAGVLAVSSLVINTIGFVLKLFPYRHKIKSILKSDCDIVFGLSPKAIEYQKNNPNTIIWSNEVSEEAYRNLVKNGIYIRKDRYDSPELIKLILRQHKAKKQTHFILFDDFKDLPINKLIQTFKNIEKNMSGENSTLFTYFNVWLHIECRFEDIDLIRNNLVGKDIDKDSKIHIVSFNYHELLARKFVIDNPMSLDIPRDKFETDSVILKPDTKINVVFLGFGKVGSALLKEMAIQYQFCKLGGKESEFPNRQKLQISQVNYYAYDFDESRVKREDLKFYFTKNYSTEFEGSSFGSIEKPWEFEIKKNYVGDESVREDIRGLVSKPNSYTYLIVSVGEDLENIKLAKSIAEEFSQYQDNFKTFVRVRSERNHISGLKQLTYFGEDKAVISRNTVHNFDLLLIAESVFNAYKDSIKTEEDAEKEIAKKVENSVPVVEQYSNVEAAISIYQKLGLMGFYLKKVSEDELGLSDKDVDQETFVERYGDIFKKDGESKKIIKVNYNSFNDFFGNRGKHVLAFIEHSRWNAYYYLNGYKQLNISDFKYLSLENGETKIVHKDLCQKKHACLTDFYDGLTKLVAVEYRIQKRIKEEEFSEIIKDKHLFDKLNEDLLKKIMDDSAVDIYKFDFMSMDRIFVQMGELKYKIKKRF